MSNFYSYGLRPDSSFDEKAEWLNVRRHRPAYFVGLDLGQSQDYSALSIIERNSSSSSGDADSLSSSSLQTKGKYQFHCTHLHRWALRTSYTSIVDETVQIMQKPELQSGPQRPMLVVDATGCGAPVIDLFKRTNHQSYLEPVLITGGSEVTKANGVWRVPKRNLVSTVQVLLQSQRLKIAGKLPQAPTLAQELQNFRAKISDSGHDSYGAGSDWREGNNDDLVLSLAMALWGATEVPVSTYRHAFRLV
jgi:hypothetical protein